MSAGVARSVTEDIAGGKMAGAKLGDDLFSLRPLAHAGRAEQHQVPGARGHRAGFRAIRIGALQPGNTATTGVHIPAKVVVFTARASVMQCTRAAAGTYQNSRGGLFDKLINQSWRLHPPGADLKRGGNLFEDGGQG